MSMLMMLMMPMMKGQPSGNQVLWSSMRHIDVNAGEAKMMGMMLHFAYGAVWGGALGLFLDLASPGGPTWLWGLGLGVVLMMLAAMVVMPLVGRLPTAVPMQGGKGMMMAGMAMAHLLYGGVTGLVLGWLWS